MGRTMKIVLVGQLDNRRHIRWGAALLLSCALGAFVAGAVTVAYFALSGGFSPLAAMIGFAGPLITVGVGIQSALQLPVEQLTPLDPAAK
jgi:hypothetical protein